MPNNPFRVAREAVGMTQVEVAARLGLDPSSVNYWESGRKSPTAANLIRLVDIYQCSADELLGIVPRSPSAGGG